MEESKKNNKNGCGCVEHSLFGVEKTPVMHVIEFACFGLGGTIGLMLFNNIFGIIGGGIILTVVAQLIQFIHRKFKK